MLWYGAHEKSIFHDFARKFKEHTKSLFYNGSRHELDLEIVRLSQGQHPESQGHFWPWDLPPMEGFWQIVRFRKTSKNSTFKTKKWNQNSKNFGQTNFFLVLNFKQMFQKNCLSTVLFGLSVPQVVKFSNVSSRRYSSNVNMVNFCYNKQRFSDAITKIFRSAQIFIQSQNDKFLLYPTAFQRCNYKNFALRADIHPKSKCLISVISNCVSAMQLQKFCATRKYSSNVKMIKLCYIQVRFSKWF